MIPQTIEELRQYCLEQGMPLEKMRFFIGENKFEPKCFGIFREGEQIIVYKNKENGSRAVRYQGYDEAEACRILYEKIQEEIAIRKSNTQAASPTRNSKASVLIFVVIMIVIFAVNILGRDRHRQGYYRVDDDLLYCMDDTFYYYDNGWMLYGGAYDTIDDYYYDDYSNDYYYDYYGDEYVPFEETEYYHEESSSSSDNSAVFDSWDSNDTNWNSDW